MEPKTATKWRLAKWTVALLALLLLGIAIGYRTVKHSLPQWLDSAGDVPAFMIDGSYGKFVDADMLALRKGACSHDPIEVSPMADGSAIVTCGFPILLGPIRLFVASAVDIPVLGIRQSAATGASR